MIGYGTEKRKTGWRYSDPRMIRLVDRTTGQYLHFSAKMATTGTKYAWLGYKHQAAALRAQAIARGDDWPYQVEA